MADPALELLATYNMLKGKLKMVQAEKPQEFLSLAKAELEKINELRDLLKSAISALKKQPPK